VSTKKRSVVPIVHPFNRSPRAHILSSIVIETALDGLLGQQLVDEDGNTVVPRLLPGMSGGEIAESERALGRPYPAEVSALLRRTGGIDGKLEEVDFAVRIDGQALDDLFPQTATIAHDGYGNFWVVDLLRENGTWGPVWFLCHDPPIALLQCDGMATFLDELVRSFMPPHASLIDDVHEDRLFRVGREHPCALPAEEAVATGDLVVAAFAADLAPGWIVVDLRDAVPGMGIAWGRFCPRTELRRCGDLQLFAYRAPKKRGLFGRKRGLAS
jgi:hypothetical protein